MYDIITIGSATIDIFVDTANKLFRKRPPFGEKILIDKLHIDTGGGAINTAIAFTRLGLKTGCLTKVGPRFIAPKEIDDSLIIRDKNCLTDHSVILDATGRDRTILVYKDASAKLTWDEIDKSKLETKWFYISSMPMELLEKFADLNAKFALNTRKAPKRLLDKAEILILNKEEAEAMGPDIKRPKICVITDKDNPIKAFHKNKVFEITPHKNIKCLERTGAGDAFASGFTAGIILKDDIDFALKLGLANSESVIQHYGAQNKLLTYDEAKQIIYSN